MALPPRRHLRNDTLSEEPRSNGGLLPSNHGLKITHGLISRHWEHPKANEPLGTSRAHHLQPRRNNHAMRHNRTSTPSPAKPRGSCGWWRAKWEVAWTASRNSCAQLTTERDALRQELQERDEKRAAKLARAFPVLVRPLDAVCSSFTLLLTSEAMRLWCSWA